MEDTNQESAEQKEGGKTVENSLSSEEKKLQKLERERTQLLSRLNDHNLDDVRTKVAFILNHYPATRDSDTALTINYWKVFHSELVGSNSVALDDLYNLTKFNTISRARAKIQNEYGLYQASTPVQERRVELESEERESQIARKPVDSAISIFCDESGKNKKYNLVGSLWINDGYRLFQVYKDLSNWKTEKGLDKELHFTSLKAQDKGIVEEFIRRVLSQSDALGFKAVILDSHAVREMSPEERNFRLHYQLIIKGIEHEVQTGRFSLPRNISVTKDKDEGADKLRLTELEQKLRTECQAYFDQEIIVDKVSAEESHSSLFIQLTDLFTASINRKLNSSGSHYKDELADTILNLLGINDVNKNQDSPQDFATILWL